MSCLPEYIELYITVAFHVVDEINGRDVGLTVTNVVCCLAVYLCVGGKC